MKMEFIIRATHDVTIKEIRANEGPKTPKPHI